MNEVKHFISCILNVSLVFIAVVPKCKVLKHDVSMASSTFEWQPHTHLRETIVSLLNTPAHNLYEHSRSLFLIFNNQTCTPKDFYNFLERLSAFHVICDLATFSTRLKLGMVNIIPLLNDNSRLGEI